jgi:vacuolar protein sorting-associated protein 13A/C
VGVKIDQCNWEGISNIALDKEGQRTYRLVPDFKEITHRLVVEICLKNHVKTVTFRSGLVLENSSFSEMQVVMVDVKGRHLTRINTLSIYLNFKFTGHWVKKKKLIRFDIF